MNLIQNIFLINYPFPSSWLYFAANPLFNQYIFSITAGRRGNTFLILDQKYSKTKNLSRISTKKNWEEKTKIRNI